MRTPCTPGYACIDLKSFYASVECQERGLDPITTNLVVADSSRTEKTVCLAVTPSLKLYHIALNKYTKKGKKKARQRATLSLRIQSPLRCLTSVFGMGTGVSTVPSSPDFFSER